MHSKHLDKTLKDIGIMIFVFNSNDLTTLTELELHLPQLRNLFGGYDEVTKALVGVHGGSDWNKGVLSTPKVSETGKRGSGIQRGGKAERGVRRTQSKGASIARGERGYSGPSTSQEEQGERARIREKVLVAQSTFGMSYFEISNEGETKEMMKSLASSFLRFSFSYLSFSLFFSFFSLSFFFLSKKSFF